MPRAGPISCGTARNENSQDLISQEDLLIPSSPENVQHGGWLSMSEESLKINSVRKTFTAVTLAVQLCVDNCSNLSGLLFKKKGSGSQC